METIKRLEVTDVTLITADEAARMSQSLLRGSTWYWTRTPGIFEGCVAYVTGGGLLMRGGTPVQDHAGAVRPVMVIGGLAELQAEIGDEVEIETAGRGIYIGNRRVLLRPVGFTKFDTEGTEYDASAIKRWIAKWWRDTLKGRRRV